MLTIFSCGKNETFTRTNIYGKWIATDFMSMESVLYSKENGFNPMIEFENDGFYNLKLDMNSCIGNFMLSGTYNIFISTSGCTKICCDSEFYNKFVQLLPLVESCQFEKNKLRLEVPGWGWINLELDY
jgi:hypothetical protein